MEYTGQTEETRGRNIWLQLSNKQSGDMDWNTLAKIADETNQGLMSCVQDILLLLSRSGCRLLEVNMVAKTHPTLLMDIGNGLFMMMGLPKLALWKTQERPKKATRGTFGYNYQTNSLEYFDGSVWYAAFLSKA